jgi:hypothetical protein
VNLLAGHLVGDFLFQNRWLAGLKRRSLLGLVLHATIYTLSVCAFAGWWDVRFWLLWLSHAVIDWRGLGKRWPDLVGQGDPDTGEPAPVWLRLVADQAWHVVALALIGRIP